MALDKYKSKRNFKSTPEPDGSKPAKKVKALRFVVQLHDASRKHYDVRLELDGTMKSWAVPKGPSLDPMERRLAVEVEDHPIEYNEFEGVIPRGNYGAGVVMIWDEGTYTARAIEFPAKDQADALRRGYAKGHMTVILEGSKLRGEFAMIRLNKSDGNNWLMVKKHDAFASREDITHADRSARTGRTLGEIAANAPKEGKLWHSNAKKKEAEAAPKKTVKKTLKKAKALPARFKKKAEETEVHPVKAVVWKPVSAAPKDKNQLIQALYDGYRAQLLIRADGGITLSAKTGVSMSKRFPRLIQDLAKVAGPLVLDGLVVPLDDANEPRRRGRLESKAALHHAFYAYDLLHAEGWDLLDLPLSERLEALTDMNLNSDHIRIPEPLDAAKPEVPSMAIGALFRSTQEPYGGKNLPRTCRGLHHAGSAIGARDEREEGPSRTVGSRHEVLNRTSRPGAPQQVALTNLSKIYWPKEKITKGELLDYYKTVSELMLPHLQGRPQSLNRHPNGINGTSFFQKEVSGTVPGWMQTATIGSGRSGKTVTYALCQTEADLLFLANMGCIEINTWLSRVDAINSPDFVVFDLDPGKIPFDAVIDTARAVKKILDQIEAPAFCKTSGSRGLHIYVPVKGAESFDEARIFAQQLSQEVHRRLPDTTSLERSPDRRTHLIYLDFLQNRIGQTMASIYSVRPKPNATVSTPLKWSEVKHGLDPGKFTIKTLPQRLDKLGDLWEGIQKAAVSLPALQKSLDKLMGSAKPPR